MTEVHKTTISEPQGKVPRKTKKILTNTEIYTFILSGNLSVCAAVLLCSTCSMLHL